MTDTEKQRYDLSVGQPKQRLTGRHERALLHIGVPIYQDPKARETSLRDTNHRERDNERKATTSYYQLVNQYLDARPLTQFKENAPTSKSALTNPRSHSWMNFDPHHKDRDLTFWL